MSEHNLYIVDTQVKSSEAAEYALHVYKQLVANGVIESESILIDDLDVVVEKKFDVNLRENLYRGGFKVRQEYTLIDRLDCGVESRHVYLISLDVLGHYWFEQNGQLMLLPIKSQDAEASSDQRIDGFFYNKECGFSAQCPTCGEEVHICDDDRAAAFNDALIHWTETQQNCSLPCDVCGAVALLSEWHSDTFAIGAFGIDLKGTGVLLLTEKREKRLLRDFGLINEPGRIAWTSCHS